MPDIVAIGELLVDFTHMTADGEDVYKPCAGGAPANVVCMTSKLGASSGFIGKIGRDMFGFALQKELRKNGVETSGLILDGNYCTTLSFVRNTPDGERDFVFYRAPEVSADLNIRYGEVNREMIDGCKILYYGSLCLTSEPSKTAVLSAVEYARYKGHLTAFDPNWRPSLWEDREAALLTIRQAAKLADIIKVSDDELQMLTDSGTLFISISKLLSQGVKIVIVTQGAKGCVVATKKGIETYPSYSVNIVDTLGAGDSFFGGFLYKLLSIGKEIDELEPEDIEQMAMLGNACGALTSSRKGAIPAMPTPDEVRALIREQANK
ncbi:MAG: carbohydrate kinase [Oscillospiraceae bacterium]|nr:carbohydrate kinase [Oscillospiraceae bacterium]